MHMEIWERTSQQLTCKLNFLQAEFQKFLFGYLEVVVAPANSISKIEIAPWRSGMDLSTVNLQAEFRKFLFGYLEVLVAPAN